MSDEARLEEGPSGLAPATRGWFVVNVADAAWRTHPRFGASWGFESRDVAPFAELGINIRFLDPGQPSGLYHSESHQEGFLVLTGEALLVVGDDQRPLRAWDFLHCPPGTDHLLVGAGDGPCVLLDVGARATDWSQQGLHYPVSEVAAGFDASVATETSNPREACAEVEWPEPGRPQAPGLPWHEHPAVPRAEIGSSGRLIDRRGRDVRSHYEGRCCAARHSAPACRRSAARSTSPFRIDRITGRARV